MVIRENEIFKRLKSVIEQAMTSLGIKGFSVLQSAQPNPTSSHGCILISRIGVRRHGWQGRRTNYDNGKEFFITEENDYIEEATYQVSAYRPRKTSDNVNTLTAYDALSGIVTWLETANGDAKMRENGFQPLRIGEIRVQTVQDDSQTPQFNPNFDWKFYIVQTIGMDVPIFYGMEPGGPGNKGIFDEGKGGPDPEKVIKYYRDDKGCIHHI